MSESWEKRGKKRKPLSLFANETKKKEIGGASSLLAQWTGLEGGEIGLLPQTSRLQRKDQTSSPFAPGGKKGGRGFFALSATKKPAFQSSLRKKGKGRVLF